MIVFFGVNVLFTPWFRSRLAMKLFTWFLIFMNIKCNIMRHSFSFLFDLWINAIDYEAETYVNLFSYFEAILYNNQKSKRDFWNLQPQ